MGKKKKKKGFKDESRCTPFASFSEPRRWILVFDSSRERYKIYCSYFGLYFFFILSKEKLIGEPGLGILRDDRYVIPLQRRNVLFSLVDRCCLKF